MTGKCCTTTADYFYLLRGHLACISTTFGLSIVRLMLNSVQAPILAVVALGSYLLIRLAYGVLTFASYPQETAKLHEVALKTSIFATNEVARSTGCTL